MTAHRIHRPPRELAPVVPVHRNRSRNLRILVSAFVIHFLLNLTTGRECLAQATTSSQDQRQVDSHEDYDPGRFEPRILASGLNRPMEIAVADDGRVFLIELDGKLRMYSPDTSELHDVGELTVTTEQENGLIGIALDPEFVDNGWIYLQYSPPDFPGQHVSRFTIRNDRLEMDSEKLLLKFEEQRKECCHHAGSMQFGPDGCLFIGTGDNTHPHGDSQGYAPIDERPGRAPWDAQKSSANSQSYSGKILRIRPLPNGTYEIPEGNLFPRDGSQGHPEIYAMGCRNPWRISVDQKSGYLYWGDVGPDAHHDGPRGPRGYDEFNQARSAGNFGWPYFIANNQAYAEFDLATGTVGPKYDSRGPRNNSPNNTGRQQLPPPIPAFIYYPYSGSERFPELGSGGRTACAGPVFHDTPKRNSATRLPAHFDNCLFIYEWTRHWIKVVRLDEDSQIQSIESFLPEHRFVRPIDLEIATNGNLYVLEYGESWGVNPEARLVRVDYIRGNRPPIARAAADNHIGAEPLTVQLRSDGSFDKDHDEPLRYQWWINRPQQSPELISTEANPAVTFTKPGAFTVELTVEDSSGGIGRASVPIIVGNSTPQVEFRSPIAGDFMTPGKPLRFELYINDREDGTSDFEEAEDKGLREIDGQAVARTAVEVSFRTGPLPGTASDSAESGPPGLRLMRSSDCFNCHAVDRKRVGPPLIEVARKYRNQPTALEASAKRVIAGSTGIWGKIPMIPHGQHTLEEAREMVTWIFSIKEDNKTQVYEGLVGEIPVKAESQQPGYFLLRARYQDLGRGEIPPLFGTAELIVRSRRVEAEHADQIQGPQVMDAESASGQKFLGAINDGHWLRFSAMPIHRTNRITVRIASAGAGGEIEFRRGSPTGTLLGKVPVEVNGEWTTFYERDCALLATEAVSDLFVVFKHSPGRSGLMNLDSLYFHPLDAHAAQSKGDSE